MFSSDLQEQAGRKGSLVNTKGLKGKLFNHTSPVLAETFLSMVAEGKVRDFPGGTCCAETEGATRQGLERVLQETRAAPSPQPARKQDLSPTSTRN